MFEKYIGSLFSKAQNRDERRFQATRRDAPSSAQPRCTGEFAL
jgi:hypothetical protein